MAAQYDIEIGSTGAAFASSTSTPFSGDRVLLVGDAVGLVSPLTATIDVPTFRAKLLLRRAFDLFQSDQLFDLLLSTGALAVAARLVYFHRRGMLSTAAWKDLLRR